MILVDTSVWVDHLRRGDAALVRALNDTMVLAHPFVVGELALGNLANRPEILALLQSLPQASVATHPEVLHMIERKRLMGRGIRWVDAHLLASVLLYGSAKLWSRDKRLRAIATTMGLAH